MLWQRQDKVCAFVNIDYEAVGNWAERQGIPYGGYVDLASKPQVLALIADCIRQVNAGLAAEGHGRHQIGPLPGAAQGTGSR